MMQSWRATLILFLTILIFSPVVVNDIVTGGDYPTNTIYVLVFMLLTLSWGPGTDSLSWKRDLTPLHAQAHKVAEFQTILPFASLVVPALGGCIAMALAWRSIKLRRETWLRDCAIVQAFLVVCVATLTI